MLVLDPQLAAALLVDTVMYLSFAYSLFCSYSALRRSWTSNDVPSSSSLPVGTDSFADCIATSTTLMVPRVFGRAVKAPAC